MRIVDGSIVSRYDSVGAIGWLLDEAVSDVDLGGMTDAELGQLDRAASSLIKQARLESLRRQEVKLRPAGRRHPGLRDHHGWRYGWADHIKRVCSPNVSGFMAFPYSLSAQDMRDLIALDDAGKWRPSVVGWRDVYFPGHTVAVVISRNKD